MFVAGIILALTGRQDVAKTVGGIIMSAGGPIAFIFAEGLTDAKGFAIEQKKDEDEDDDESELLLLTDDEEDTSCE
jgi:hypothetical protein